MLRAIAPLLIVLGAFVTLPACEQYPFLDDSTAGGGSGTLGLFGTSTGGSTGGSSTNTNSNSANTNANTTDEDALPTDGTADVAQLICDNYIIALERDGSRDQSVYAMVSDGDFANWQVGDDLGFLATNGAFVNFSRDENLKAEIIGTYNSVTLLVDRNDFVQTLTLQNGSVWTYAASDAEEARLWQTRADRVTIVDTGDSNAAILINMTRCTAIPATQN